MKAEREKIIKEFNFCTCEFEHHKSSKTLWVRFFKKGRYCFVCNFTQMRASFVKKFISSFSEYNAKELFINNITIL